MSDVFEKTRQIEQMSAAAPAEAFRLALSITAPAARAHALALLARYATADIARSALKEARSAARACNDGYSAAVALAEPICAALERGNENAARQMLADAISFLSSARTVSERAEALRQLFDAVIPGGRAFWLQIANELKRQCPAHIHWRAARAHLRAISSLNRHDRDPALAHELFEAMEPGKVKRHAGRILQSGRTRHERVFFRPPN